jgi:hypothetical protein
MLRKSSIPLLYIKLKFSSFGRSKHLSKILGYYASKRHTGVRLPSKVLGKASLVMLMFATLVVAWSRINGWSNN